MKKLICLFLVVLSWSCSPKLFNKKWTKQIAPKEFTAVFETTKGEIKIFSKRAWSPKGVDRLYSLINNNFYTDMAIFRVVPNFVAQFGIHNDSVINKSWDKYGISDEPVIAKNDSMTISFARDVQDSRTTQLFINLKANNRLDTLTYSKVKGFPVIAKVVKGAENVLKFYDKYGSELGNRQDSIQKYGNAFLRKKYPKIDFIKKAYILK